MKDYVTQTERLNFGFNGLKNLNEQKFNVKSSILKAARDEVIAKKDYTTDESAFHYDIALHLADKLAMMHILNSDITLGE